MMTSGSSKKENTHTHTVVCYIEADINVHRQGLTHCCFITALLLHVGLSRITFNYFSGNLMDSNEPNPFA